MAGHLLMHHESSYKCRLCCNVAAWVWVWRDDEIKCLGGRNECIRSEGGMLGCTCRFVRLCTQRPRG